MHTLHDIHTYEIAKDGDDIGHHTTLALAEFDESPTLMMAIEGDEESGSEDREDIHESEDHHLVGQWQQTEVAQRKQNNEPHSGQVEGIEHCAQHPCAQYQFISSLHFNISIFNLQSSIFNLQFSTFNFQPSTFPKPLHRYPEHLAIFRHSASGYGITPFGKQSAEGLVGQGARLVLIVDEIFQCRLYLAC